MKEQILQWMCTGETGLSSETMAMCAVGMINPRRFPDHPHDPDDFRRCVLLARQVPEIREHFPKIALLTPTWGRLIDNWDRIEALLIHEVGSAADLHDRICMRRRSAPKTYELIQSILYPPED